MAKKSKSGGRPGSKKSEKKQKHTAAGGGPVKPVILFAAFLFASACIVYAFEGLIGCGAALKYAASLASGILSGISGNPLWYSLPAGIASKFGAPAEITALFPAKLILGQFKPETALLIISSIMAAASFYDGVKNRRIRYEPAVLIPATALPVMYLAMQMRTSSAAFYNLFKSVFAGPFPIGFIAAVTIILGMAKWAMRSDSGGRHWVLSFAAGPVIGFWFGYLEYSWPASLIALLYFSYLFIFSESDIGIIYGLPLAAMPMIAGKIILAKAAGATPVAATGPVPWTMVFITVAGFTIAYLFATRLMAALPASVRRAFFFITLIIFLASVLAGVK